VRLATEHIYLSTYYFFVSTDLRANVFYSTITRSRSFNLRVTTLTKNLGHGPRVVQLRECAYAMTRQAKIFWHHGRKVKAEIQLVGKGITFLPSYVLKYIVCSLIEFVRKQPGAQTTKKQQQQRRQF